LDSFFALPRYPFTRAMIEHAPEEVGLYGLFAGTELIYLASCNSIHMGNNPVGSDAGSGTFYLIASR
jgi:hypothetical protein